MIGKTILHYKILEKLGEGGMGVVYKAEDTKLERTVALKFLSLASIGEEEKKRFKREAKAAASLNHPNIATVFAIDEADDQTFIAMEFIEGQSLQEIVGANRGKPMPIDKAIDYATQTAAGLQAAHEKGITHRDIKSANIMVTDKGQIKIMDFGLAKLANRSMMTKVGTTLGTTSYMSPEQARGEEVDHRADIWSLGVVLYEMISGQLPFKGDYDSAVVYSILHEEPEPLTALRTGVPISLDGIIAKALAKEADTRYQHVDELPVDLKGIETATLSRSGVSTKQPRQSAWPSKLPWIVATLMTVIAAVALVRLMQIGSDASTEQNFVKRAHLVLPEEAPLELIGSAPFAAGQTALTLSPDGRQLVYVAKHNGSTRLFLRPLDRFKATALPGTDGAYYPFFSPDGKWVGFFADNAMKKVAIEGGEPVEICEVTHPYGATWASNDQIFFSNHDGVALMQVSAAGGKPASISEHSSSEVSSYYWPSILPGTKHLLIQTSSSSIHVLTLENLGWKLLLAGGSNPRFLPTGHLVYAQPGRLMAVPFDLELLVVTGSPVPIIEHVRTESLRHAAQYGISDEGTLIYARGGSAGKGEFVMVDPRGAVSETLPLPADSYGAFALSPSGDRLAYTVSAAIWIHDTSRNMRSRLTHRGNNFSPIWMRDGARVVFTSDRAGPPNLFLKSIDGGEAKRLTTSDYPHYPTSVSPDGKHLLYYEPRPDSKEDIWLLPMTGNPEPFLKTENDEWGAKFSLDGRYVAYTSDESGQYEVYVRPFPATGERWKVSAEGGGMPIWSHKGDELFYRRLSMTEMMVVTVNTKVGFEYSRPKVLFAGNYLDVPGDSYDIYPDGEHFLMLKATEQGTTRKQLNVVFNWFEEVKRRVPTNK